MNLSKNKKEYNLFGIKLFSEQKDYNHKTKIFLGLISKEKIYKNFTETRTINICNRKIITRTEDDDSIEYNILDIFKKKINKTEQTKRILKKYLSNKYNKIFILKSNLGEAYLFLKYIFNGLIEKSDTPIIIATKKYHLELIEMLTPDIDCKLLTNLKYETSQKYFTIDNKYVYTAFPMKFYIETEDKVRLGQCHYLSEIYNYFMLSKENIFEINKIKIKPEVQKNVSEYLKEHNISKFIFISTKANTCECLDEEFWNELEKQLHIKTIRNNKNFSIGEAYTLASKATAIISLRSGLSEILSETNKPHIVLYTNFKKRYRFDKIPESQVSKCYSIIGIFPERKNIYEIAYSQEYKKQIINWISDTVNMRIK